MNSNQLATTSVNPRLITSQPYESSQLNHFFHQFYPDELTATGQYQPEHLEYHGQQQPRIHEETTVSNPYHGDFVSDYERVSHGIETMSVNPVTNQYYSAYHNQPQQPPSMIAAQTSPKYIREASENLIPSTSETEERNQLTQEPSKEKKKKSSGSRTGSGGSGIGGKKKGSRCKLETEPDDGPKKRRKSVTTLQPPPEDDKSKSKNVKSLVRQRRASLPALSPESIQKKMVPTESIFNAPNGVGVLFYPETTQSEEDRPLSNLGTPTASPINEDNSSEETEPMYTKLKEPQIKVTRSGKRRLKWTTELSELFAKAVEKLGPGAVPSAILEEMGVQGLTRGNISSHLQKYRLEARQKQLQKQAEEEQQLQQQHLLQLQFQQHLQHERVVKMVYPPLAVPPTTTAAHAPPSPTGAHLHSSGSSSSLGAPAMIRGGSAYDVHDEYGTDNGDLHLYLNSMGSLSESRGSGTNVDLLFSSGGSTGAPMLSTASYNLAQSTSSVPSSPNSSGPASSKQHAPYASPYMWVDPSSSTQVERHYGGYHPATYSVPYYCYGCSCGMSGPGGSHHHPTGVPGSAQQCFSSTESPSTGMDLSNNNVSSSNNSSANTAAINASTSGGVEN